MRDADRAAELIPAPRPVKSASSSSSSASPPAPAPEAQSSPAPLSRRDASCSRPNASRKGLGLLQRGDLKEGTAEVREGC
jgi:hypothetical protein